MRESPLLCLAAQREFDDLFGALGGADAAAGAVARIHLRNAVHDMDGVRRAGVLTVAVAEAAVSGTATIDASALANGVYFVKLNNGKTVKVVK